MESDPELYVYALAAPGLPGELAAGERTLEVLRAGEVDVVVERGRAKRDPSAEAIGEQHGIVMDLLQRGSAILPARFGSVISEQELKRIVARRSSEIEKALALVKGHRQMTLRVFGEPDTSRPPEARRTSGTAFLESLRERAHHVPPEATVIRAHVDGLVSAERVEPGAAGARLVAFHLVVTDRVEEYRNRAASLESKLAPHRVLVTGPWPAFAFAPELF
jgi:hypothetical protein